MKTYLLPILLVISHQMIAGNPGSESSLESSGEECDLFALSKACQPTIPTGTLFSITVGNRKLPQKIGKRCSAQTLSQEELLLAAFDSVQDQLPEYAEFSVTIGKDSIRRDFDGEVEIKWHSEGKPFH